MPHLHVYHGMVTIPMAFLTAEDLAIYLYIQWKEIKGYDQAPIFIDLCETEKEDWMILAHIFRPYFVRIRRNEMIERIATYMEQNQCEHPCGAYCATVIRRMLLKKVTPGEIRECQKLP